MPINDLFEGRAYLDAGGHGHIHPRRRCQQVRPGYLSTILLGHFWTASVWRNEYYGVGWVGFSGLSWITSWLSRTYVIDIWRSPRVRCSSRVGLVGVMVRMKLHFSGDHRCVNSLDVTATILIDGMVVPVAVQSAICIACRPTKQSATWLGTFVVFIDR